MQQGDTHEPNDVDRDLDLSQGSISCTSSGSSVVMCLCSNFPGGVPSEAQTRCFHFVFQVQSPIPALFQPSVTLPLDETDRSHSDDAFSFPFNQAMFVSFNADTCIM